MVNNDFYHYKHKKIGVCRFLLVIGIRKEFCFKHIHSEADFSVRPSRLVLSKLPMTCMFLNLTVGPVSFYGPSPWQVITSLMASKTSVIFPFISAHSLQVSLVLLRPRGIYSTDLTVDETEILIFSHLCSFCILTVQSEGIWMAFGIYQEPENLSLVWYR